MTRNVIDRDQVAARLGDMRQHRSYEDMDEEDDSSEQSLNTGFLVMVLGMFFAVALGTYIYVGGSNPFKSVKMKTSWGDGGASYVSPLDVSCGKAWVEGARNDTVLMCYLTTKMERLCDPRERKHLGRILDRYRSDKLLFEARMDAEGMASGSITQNSGSKIPPELFLEREVLVAAIRKVGAMGYMVKSDYGWMADSLVKDAYKGQLQPPSPCKTQ